MIEIKFTQTRAGWMRRLILITVILNLAQPAFASEEAMDKLPKCEEIILQYMVEGGTASADKAQFTLTALSENCPMPEGSDCGKKSIEVTGPGKVSFGKMTFTKPEVYTYKVTRNEDPGDGYGRLRDASEHRITITVLNNGQIDQIIQRPGEGTKGELIYTDAVRQTPGKNGSNDVNIVDLPDTNAWKESEHGVKTGDLRNPILAGMIACAALTVLLFIAAVRYRSKYDQR